ncbi:MAG TPA: HAMP domain-containing sensor histidine kinase [Candidatus Sulfotelmatobacter sp.]|jgi:two-component system sensor histidine kinase CiaH|nr:HAMP domain-containing sensor histidine kinase [Candidatus Sulfotelmatobacter sp.]
MFQSARLKLTAWYLVIIMLVSITFSFAFYRTSTFELNRLISRVRFLQTQRVQMIIPSANFVSPPPNMVLDELESVKIRLQIALIVINGIIFVLAGGAGYFLAGRTLRPIQVMVDEQNQFISDASHELRTPIATLRAEMEASLLEKHLSDKEARALIASNLEELGKLQELTNSLLQLAHVNQKDEHLTEVLSLEEVILTAYKKVASIAKKKQVVFEIASIKGKVKGDKNSLVEVFVNLFDNAIKYSSNKTTVSIIATKRKHTTVITVADQGLGITSNDIAHIFDRFYRADKSRSQADGHGLGLSIAKKIVIAHNGSIDVNSIFGKGTTFIITLPLIS